MRALSTDRTAFIQHPADHIKHLALGDAASPVTVIEDGKEVDRYPYLAAVW
ncbi:MAG: hypothetical protein R3F37_19970 [Candidatus Competibacteraceae bacterium]